MKHSCFLLLLLVWYNVSLAQGTNSQGGNSIQISLNCSPNENSPLFVIYVDNYQGLFKSLTLDFIKPDWIQEIKVHKKTEAVRKYGDTALGGAIEITCKKGYNDSIPEEYRNSFQKVSLNLP